MFTIKRGICTNKGDNSKFIFCKNYALLDLEILVKFLFLYSNVTRGHTFKIKSSYSRALAPACSTPVKTFNLLPQDIYF